MARRIAPALAATMIPACGGDGAPTDLPDASSGVADARAAMTMVRSAHLRDVGDRSGTRPGVLKRPIRRPGVSRGLRRSAAGGVLVTEWAGPEVVASRDRDAAPSEVVAHGVVVAARRVGDGGGGVW